MDNMEIKSKEIKSLYEAFLNSAEPELFNYFSNKVGELDDFSREYEKHLQKVKDAEAAGQSVSDLVQVHKEFKEKVLELLLAEQQGLKDGDFESLFGEYSSVLKEKTGDLNKTIVKKERYKKYPYRRSEGPLLWIRKAFANTAILFRLLSKKLLNLLLPLFKKQPLGLDSYRKRRVPFRNMVQSYLMVKLPEEILDHVVQANKIKSQFLVKLWNFDEETSNSFQLVLSGKKSGDEEGKTDTETKTEQEKDQTAEDPEEFFRLLRQESSEKIKELNDTIRSLVEQVFISFDKAFQVVDTLELPASDYSQEKLKAQRRRMDDNYINLTDRWKNTHYTLLDDWAVDVEIIKLYYSVYDRYNVLRSEIDGFVSMNLEKSFSSISSFIKQSTDRISKAPASVKQVRDVIRAEREKVNRELVDKILAQSIENLTKYFTEDFDKLLEDTHELAGQISDRRGYVRIANYDRGIRDSEIKTISPRELLNIEALQAFTKNVAGIKEVVDSHLEKVRLALLTLGTVCDFNLETALMLITKEKKGAGTARETAMQGYERALLQLESARSIIGEIQDKVLDELRDSVNSFNKDIQKLKNTDNVFELQVKIAHIRTRERSLKLKKQAVQYVLDLVPNVIEFFRKTFVASKELLQEIKVKTGMSSEKKTVSYELMEFINDTQVALKKLPYVYQRLYQIQPTEEERFFVNRDNELERMKECYDNWKKGRYITCAVIGEKGSGTTSLVNYFLLKYAQDNPVINHTLSEKIYSPEKYFKLFNQILKKENIESNQQLIDLLNESPEQRVIVLENLQHMFLKRVNGFAAMKLFFELISHTSQKVLWVGIFTPVSYKYLDQTVYISNYFSDTVRMEGLRDTTIREIIYKRNNLSGYRIRFVPSEQMMQSKSFLKYDEKGRQQYLEDQFFSKLNKVSNGNISLAQMHWLSSTLKVDEQFINIGAIHNPDVSFVKSLPGDRLFALQSIILHDGLTLEDFAEVMNETEPFSRNLLIPMLEKGLLIRPRQKFNINPVIYKPVYEYLLSRNFIH
jgi:hypothetical protein